MRDRSRIYRGMGQQDKRDNSMVLDHIYSLEMGMSLGVGVGSARRRKINETYFNFSRDTYLGASKHACQRACNVSIIGYIKRFETTLLVQNTFLSASRYRLDSDNVD